MTRKKKKSNPRKHKAAKKAEPSLARQWFKKFLAALTVKLAVEVLTRLFSTHTGA